MLSYQMFTNSLCSKSVCHQLQDNERNDLNTIISDRLQALGVRPSRNDSLRTTQTMDFFLENRDNILMVPGEVGPTGSLVWHFFDAETKKEIDLRLLQSYVESDNEDAFWSIHVEAPWGIY